ncbi:glycosyl hydrolase family 28-related protein [Falsiroseomonas sp.]|uniref:glycosyl hydrolase family 28-related protein n=1 Tax=Falsiroseomonas sp. TaxID=2870721 RepID=UPI00271A2CFA|nr:glycosyl hydrolase family 28-related protein [Falsiroseomonas sp.]MDO9498481.1 glycosyl hydrolase family 28-related protein [Falsiroseomonas sp.]
MAEHIRIGDVAPRVQYLGDGSRVAFTYPFPIFHPSDMELRLDGVPVAGGFTVSGAGNSEGGSVILATPPASGSTVTLRRRIRVERSTDFQDNGVLRARTLNDELDRIVATMQEQREEITAAIRQDPAEVGGSFTLPLRTARANRMLGFDGTGNLVVLPRDSGLISAPFPGAVPYTVEDKLAEQLSARDFGATGDGVTEDGPALQAAMNAAGASGKRLLIGEGTYRTTQPLTLPGAAAGLTMRGTIVYAGPAGPALTIGDGGTARNASKWHNGLSVLRATIGAWEDEAEIGILLRNHDASIIEVRRVEGFTIGVRTLGDGRGFEDSTLEIGRIVNNKIGLDVHTATAAGWNTSIRYHGGHFAVGSTVHVDKDRFGIRLSAAPGAYVAHNRHLFNGQNFELNALGRPITGIPFLCEVNSRAIIARGLRMEGCTGFVARHTGAAQDHVYEVTWASQGYMVEIDHAASSTRLGGVVEALHQAAPHRAATRELASVPSLRAAAIRWNATQTGFEKLACLSSNVSGSPAVLQDFVFPALESFSLTNRGVVLTGGRAVGFVVDARACRDFALSVDADAPRLFVMCFDAANALLTDSLGPLVRASGQSMVWNPTARWFQGAADMTDAGLSRLQAVRLSPLVATAVIGVARIGTDYELRALRLNCDPRHAPAVLYGLPDLPIGVRELVAELPWDPASIAAGASAQINVAVPGARPGDFAQAAFSLSTSGAVFLAQIGAQDVVTVTAWNRTGAALDLNAGTVRVRVVKA